MNGRPILEEWFQQAINIARIYLSNRQLQLQKDIQKVENEGTKEDRIALRPIKMEAKDIGYLINNVVRLRMVTLDELIDDVLIQEEISKLRASDAMWRSLEGGMEGKIAHLHKDLATVPASISSQLRSSEKKDVQEIRTILAVFIRRELFNSYLRQARQLTMENWLKAQRKKAHIVIHDEHVPKRGGIKLW